MLKKIFFIIALLMVSFIQTQAQSFGFGCLGLVGGYGGYSYQQYQPGMLNDFVNDFNSAAINKLNQFGKAEGYRFGLHFFRANFSGFFITAKGYYQQLGESHSAQITGREGPVSYDFDLNLKSWGIGLDVGIPILSMINWKIVDGAILINSARFTLTSNSFSGTSVQKFNNEKTEIGYSVGSGFVIDVIKNYISIEGIAAYSYLKIDKMETDDNIKFKEIFTPIDENQPFIKSGGFNAVLQLNVGFPL
ncbi:MAG: hypothetical protein WHT45_04725 [Ignavibacterium sp.]